MKTLTLGLTDADRERQEQNDPEDAGHAGGKLGFGPGEPKGAGCCGDVEEPCDEQSLEIS